MSYEEDEENHVAFNTFQSYTHILKSLFICTNYYEILINEKAYRTLKLSIECNQFK